MRVLVTFLNNVSEELQTQEISLNEPKQSFQELVNKFSRHPDIIELSSDEKHRDEWLWDIADSAGLLLSEIPVERNDSIGNISSSAAVQVYQLSSPLKRNAPVFTNQQWKFTSAVKKIAHRPNQSLPMKQLTYSWSERNRLASQKRPYQSQMCPLLQQCSTKTSTSMKTATLIFSRVPLKSEDISNRDECSREFSILFANFLSPSGPVRLVLRSSVGEGDCVVIWNWRDPSSPLDVYWMPQESTFIPCNSRSWPHDVILCHGNNEGKFLIPCYENFDEANLLSSILLHSGASIADQLCQMNQLSHCSISLESLEASLTGLQLDTISFFFKSWQERLVSAFKREFSTDESMTYEETETLSQVDLESLLSSIGLIRSYAKMYMSDTVNETLPPLGFNSEVVISRRRWALQLLHMLNTFLVYIVAEWKRIPLQDMAKESRNKYANLLERFMQCSIELRASFRDPFHINTSMTFTTSKTSTSAVSSDLAHLSHANFLSSRERIRLRRRRAESCDTETVALSDKVPSEWHEMCFKEVMEYCLLHGQMSVGSAFCEKHFGRVFEPVVLRQEMQRVVKNQLKDEKWANVINVLLNAGVNPRAYLISYCFNTENGQLRDRVLKLLNGSDMPSSWPPLHDSSESLPWNEVDLSRLCLLEQFLAEETSRKGKGTFSSIRISWACELTNEECDEIAISHFIKLKDDNEMLNKYSSSVIVQHLLQHGDIDTLVRLLNPNNQLLSASTQLNIKTSLLKYLIEHSNFSEADEEDICECLLSRSMSWIPTFGRWQLWTIICSDPPVLLLPLANTIEENSKRLSLTQLLRHVLTFSPAQKTLYESLPSVSEKSTSPLTLSSISDILPHEILPDLVSELLSLAVEANSSLAVWSVLTFFSPHLSSSSNERDVLTELVSAYQRVSSQRETSAEETLHLAAVTQVFLSQGNSSSNTPFHLSDDTLLSYFLIGRTSEEDLLNVNRLQSNGPTTDTIASEEIKLIHRLKCLLQAEPPSVDSLDSRVTVYDLLSWSNYPLQLKRAFFWQQDNRFALETLHSEDGKFMPSFRCPHPETSVNPQLPRPPVLVEKLTFSYFLREGRPIEAYVTLLSDLAEKGFHWEVDSDLALEVNCWIHRFALRSLDYPLVLSSCCMLQQLLGLDRRILSCHLRVVHCLEKWCLHGSPCWNEKEESTWTSGNPTIRDIHILLRDLLLDCAYSKSKRYARAVADQLLYQMEKALLWKLEIEKLKDVEYVIEQLYLMTEFSDVHGITRLPDGILHYYASHNDWLTFLCVAETFAYESDQVKEAIQEFGSSSLRDHLSYVISKTELTSDFIITTNKGTLPSDKSSAPRKVSIPEPTTTSVVTSNSAKTYRMQLLQKVKAMGPPSSKKPGFASTSEMRPLTLETVESPVTKEDTSVATVVNDQPGTVSTVNDVHAVTSGESASVSLDPVSVSTWLQSRQISLSRLRSYGPSDLSSLLFDCTELLQINKDASELEKSNSQIRQTLSILWPRLLSYSIALPNPLLAVLANCCGCDLIDASSLRSIRISTQRKCDGAQSSSSQHPVQLDASLIFHKTLTEVCIFIVASLPKIEYDTIVNGWHDYVKLSWTKEEAVQIFADLISHGICSPMEETLNIFMPHYPYGSLMAVLRHAVECWNPILRQEFKQMFISQCEQFYTETESHKTDLNIPWLREMFENAFLSSLCYLLKERGAQLCLIFLNEWIKLTDTNRNTRRFLSLTNVINPTLVRDLLSILLRYITKGAESMITCESLGLASSPSRCVSDPQKPLTTLLLKLYSNDQLCVSNLLSTKSSFSSLTNVPRPSPHAVQMFLKELKAILPSLSTFQFPSVAYDLPAISKEQVATFISICLPPGVLSGSINKISSSSTCNWRDRVSISIQLVNTTLENPFDVHVRQPSIEESDSIELMLKEGRFIEAHEYTQTRNTTHRDLYYYKTILLLVCNYQVPHQIPSNVQQMIDSVKQPIPIPTTISRNSNPISANPRQSASTRSTREPPPPVDGPSNSMIELSSTVNSLLQLMKHGRNYAENCLRLLLVAWRLNRSYLKLVQCSEMEVICDILSNNNATAMPIDVQPQQQHEDRIHILYDYIMAVIVPEEELLPCLFDTSLLVLLEECEVDNKSPVYPSMMLDWFNVNPGMGTTAVNSSGNLGMAIQRHKSILGTSGDQRPSSVGALPVMGRKVRGALTPEEVSRSPNRTTTQASQPRPPSNSNKANAVSVIKKDNNGAKSSSSASSGPGGIFFGTTPSAATVRSVSPSGQVRPRPKLRKTIDSALTGTSQRHRSQVTLLARCCYNRLARSVPQFTNENSSQQTTSSTYKNISLSVLIYTFCGISVPNTANGTLPSARGSQNVGSVMTYQNVRSYLSVLSVSTNLNSKRERCIRLLSTTGQHLLSEVERVCASGRITSQYMGVSTQSSTTEGTGILEEDIFNNQSEIGGVAASETEYLVELIILAHSCFQRIDNSEGISHCLKVSRQIAPGLASRKRYNQLVRLLRGLRHYNEMTYIFDFLVQAEKFELLLGKSEDKENTIVPALLEYLQRYHPQNTELLGLVCFKHSLWYELAGVYQKKAHAIKHRLKEAMKEGGDMKLMQNLCIEAAQHLVQAAIHYERDSFLQLARTCFREAQVYLVQIRWLQYPASLVNCISPSSGITSLPRTGLPSGVEVLELKESDALLWLRHNSSFYEAYIWGACERIQQSPVFPQLLCEHVLLRGDLRYLQTYLDYHGGVLSDSVLEKCVKHYKRNKISTAKTQVHLQEFLKRSNNQFLVEKIRKECLPTTS